MATNQKKGKKSKGVTISFQEFSSRLEGDNTTSGNVVYAEPKKQNVMSSWADEVEEDEQITAKERIVLPTAPRASRGPAYEDSQIPRSPPFQANIGNLHYDIEEEDIYKFFRELDILELKLPKDHVTNRIKGFGFVVFGTRNDLVEALVMNEQVLRGRPIRVALLSGDQRVGDRDRAGRSSSARGPAEDEGVDNWRDMARGQGADFRPQNNDFRNNQDFRRDENFRAPSDNFRSSDNFRREDNNFRRPNDDHNEEEGEWRGGPRENRDHTQEQDFVRGPTQPRNYERTPARAERAERERDDEPKERKERKKLILLPKSGEVVAMETGKRSSIFGDAKPVDTKKREMEIEEKLRDVAMEDKVVRLLTRDGSERIINTNTNPNPTKWRTPSQSSHEDSKQEHSDPEDERDLKQGAYTREERRNEERNEKRNIRDKRIKRVVDKDGFLITTTTTTTTNAPVEKPLEISTPPIVELNKFAALDSDQD